MRARKRLGMERIELSDDDIARIDRLGEGDEARVWMELLAPEQRAAIAAHVIDERPYGEIANDLETSEAVVRKRVSRGLATMSTADRSTTMSQDSSPNCGSSCARRRCARSSASRPRSRLMRSRRRLPGPAPLAAALAVALLARWPWRSACSQLRGESEPMTPKVIHSFHVADALTSMAEGFGAVWATDPVSTARCCASIRRRARSWPASRSASGGERQCRSPEVSGAHRRRARCGRSAGDLLNAGAKGAVELARIDPRRNRVVARIPERSAGGHLSPRASIIGRPGLRLGHRDSRGAIRIDPASNAPDRYVAYGLPTRPGEPAAPTGTGGGQRRGAGRAGCGCSTSDGRLLQIDARTGRTVAPSCSSRRRPAIAPGPRRPPGR